MGRVIVHPSSVRGLEDLRAKHKAVLVDSIERKFRETVAGPGGLTEAQADAGAFGIREEYRAKGSAAAAILASRLAATVGRRIP
jgi:hypothetical protein